MAASRARSLCSIATRTLAETVPFIFDGKTKASFTSIPLLWRWTRILSSEQFGDNLRIATSQKLRWGLATPSRVED